MKTGFEIWRVLQYFYVIQSAPTSFGSKRWKKSLFHCNLTNFDFWPKKWKNSNFANLRNLLEHPEKFYFFAICRSHYEEKKPFYRLAFYFLQLTLRELEAEKEMKPSLSAHIHRDRGIHIALTEKVSNKCDQVTFPAPNK